ncbi:MAG: glycine cleavage T C-terminal barrel domain-containing protein, partial [Cyclobacteriaceae bacterium]
PSLDKGIGMGYVRKEYSTPESEILVEVRNKQLKAKVVKPPFLK